MEIRAYNAFDPGATTEIIPEKLLERGSALVDGFRQFVAEHELVDAWQLDRSLCLSFRDLASCSDQGAEELAQVYADYLRSTLRLSETRWGAKSEVTVRKMDLTKALYLTRYAMAKTLELLLGREAGIEQLKGYLDWSISNRPALESPPETLREMWDGDVQWNRRDQGQDAVTAMQSGGRLLKKVTACRIHHVLAPFGDPELMQTIACYPDYANIQRTNPHFVLTRTQVLMTGGTCCDTCFHDARSSDLRHPSPLVFATLHDRSG